MRGGSNVLLSPEQVAQKLGVSRKTVYRRWQEWGLRSRPIGRLLRFAERDVNNFIEGTTESPNARDMRGTTAVITGHTWKPTTVAPATAFGFGKDKEC